MGYAYLLNIEASLVTFRQDYSVPDDVEVAYCHESEIILHRGANTAFFPLMSILEGGVRFPIDPLLLDTLRYYGLSPDQLHLNFYRVVSCVSRLNQTFGLQLDHHDINHMYSLCGKKRSNQYIYKCRDLMRQCIRSCHVTLYMSFLQFAPLIKKQHCFIQCSIYVQNLIPFSKKQFTYFCLLTL